MKRFIKKGVLAFALALILIGGTLSVIAWGMGAETQLSWGGGRLGFFPSTAREINMTFSDDFDRINVDLGVANVTVQEGTSFSATGQLSDRVTISTDNNTLVITEARARGPRFNIGFGFSRQSYYLVLTVPHGTALDTLSIETGVGRVEVENIEAARADIHSGVGNVHVRNVEFGHTILDSGVGDVYADGIFTGRTDLSSGVGNVSLTLPGARDDYAYRIQADIGNASINGERTGSATRSHANPVADLRLSSGVGNVRVDFRG